MLKKTITYEDFAGETRTEDFYFHLSKTEMAQMELSVGGGLREQMQLLIQKKEVGKMVDVLRNLVVTSYGERSADGRNFRKTDAIREDFMSTPAYDIVFMEIATDAEAAAAFVRGILPKDLTGDFDKEVQKLKIEQNFTAGQSESS